MTVLVVGGDGLIGCAIGQQLRANYHTALLTSRNQANTGTIYLDLLNVDAFLDDNPPKVDAVIIAAAVTKFEECRKYPEKAYISNVEAPVKIARYYSQFNSKILFLSTSSVFSGATGKRSAEDIPDGTSKYGIIKAKAESALLNLNAQVSILRLSKVVSRTNNLFSSWMSELAEEKTIKCFKDQYISPITLDLAIRAILAIIVGESSGIYQLSAKDDISYLDVGYRLADMLNVSQDLVEPVIASEAGIPLSEIYRFTSLDADRLRRSEGIDSPGPFEFLNYLQ